MSTEVIDREQAVTEDVETAVGDSPAAAETDPKEALRWFEIVEIPEAGFRCFVRLPNDYQHKDIREKAMAAKARRIRALRNADTDAWEVLEHEMNTIGESEGAVESLVHELLLERVDRDRYDAIQEVSTREEYEHVHQDQERYREMSAMGEDRPEEEWTELLNHLAGFARAIEDEVQRMQEPRKAALTGMGLPGLLDKVRERRIDAEGRRAFNDTYAFWQTYVGTLEIPDGFDPKNVQPASMPRQRIFKDESELREVDPLIGARIGEAFELLEGALSTLTSGNS